MSTPTENASNPFEEDEHEFELHKSSSDESVRGSFNYTFGWNIESLYTEVLYNIIHHTKNECSELSENSLFEYVKAAFKISEDFHVKCFEFAKNKQPPAIRLDVEVIEAKDLEAKDLNGLSDPFVTMYLSKTPGVRCNTSVKPETLNPTWEEQFSMPMTGDYVEDSLVVEVWDYDAVEPVKNKVNKIFEVKSVKALRKLMREITLRKDYKEFIGRATIPLRSIPACGLTMWYNVSRKSKIKNTGMLKLRFNFSSEKNCRVSTLEYRRLMRHLLRHELETSKVAFYWWSGEFSPDGKTILAQHATQCGLSTTELTLAQWIVYSSVHTDHPISLVFLESILDKLLKSIVANNLKDAELKLFWEWTTKFLPSCFKEIRKLKCEAVPDKNVVKNLENVLNIISKICVLEPMTELGLFPVQYYGWIENMTANSGMRDLLENSVKSGASEWFTQLFNVDLSSGTIGERINLLIQTVQNLVEDIQKSGEIFDKVFEERMKIQFSKTVYDAYKLNLVESYKKLVPEICKSLIPLKLPDEKSCDIQGDQNTMDGTALFKLYNVLKNFFQLHNYLNDVRYHEWFADDGVDYWMTLSAYKAMVLIKKAVDLDKLEQVDDTTKYSSSAVDFLGILNQIKLFWEQMSWPDKVCTCSVATKLGVVIKNCLQFYITLLFKLIENGTVQTTIKKCLIVNDLEHVYKNLIPFLEDFQFSNIKSENVAAKCSDSLTTVVAEFIVQQKPRSQFFISAIQTEIAPNIKKLFGEGADNIMTKPDSMDPLMAYLDRTLKILNDCLDDKYYQSILSSIWNDTGNIFYDYIAISVEKWKSPAFYCHLLSTLKMMDESFRFSEVEKLSFDHIEMLLKLHGYKTTDLIHEYYKNRLSEQKKLTETPYGILTVQCFFKGDTLEINIMNARDLKCYDNSCDSFVRIHFIPDEKFTGVLKPKTNVKLNTTFPLYDEKFVIRLSPQQRDMKDAIILFSVKDKNLFGMANQYLAECYLGFDEIIEGSKDARPEQIHLKMSRPQVSQGFTTYSFGEKQEGHISSADYIHVLEYRQDDKQAKEFVRKISKG